MLFMLTLWPAMLLPNIPLGMTQAVMMQQELTGDIEPFRLLAWGLLYYLGLTLWTARCTIKSTLPPKPKPEPITIPPYQADA